MAEGGRGGTEGSWRHQEQPWETAEGRNSRHGNSVDRNQGSDLHPQRQQQGRARGSFGPQQHQGQDNRTHQAKFVPSNANRQPPHNQRNSPGHFRGVGPSRGNSTADWPNPGAEGRRPKRGTLNQQPAGSRSERDHTGQTSEKDEASQTSERDEASKSTESYPDSLKTEPREPEKDGAKQYVAKQDVAGEERGREGRGRKPPPAAIAETEGDLFTAPSTSSLAHCVAADFRMGSGIAVTFLDKFKRVAELLDQRKTVGEVAVLADKDRHIYYLVTKKLSSGKPTYATLRQSLERMREHCVENNVASLAMPRVGCGLDRLAWVEVKRMLGEVFAGTHINITIYNYPQSDQLDVEVTRKASRLYISHHKMNLVDIETKTGLLYLCSEELSETPTMASLDAKHRFMLLFRQEARKCGNVVRIQRGDEVLYGLVVRKKADDPVSFVALEASLRKLRKYNEKDFFVYFGLEAFRDPGDEIVMEKVVTCFRSVLGFLSYKLDMWFCWPKEFEVDHVWEEERAMARQ